MVMRARVGNRSAGYGWVDRAEGFGSYARIVEKARLKERKKYGSICRKGKKNANGWKMSIWHSLERQLGSVTEKCELYVDAWHTYEPVLTW